MLRFIKSFFKKNNEPVDSAEYRVEAPIVTPVVVPPVAEPAKCGCGRSATGFCVGLHKLTAEEWAVHSDNPNKAAAQAPAPNKKPAARTPAKGTAKPAAITAAPKKPRAKKQAK
jgi:hypothetical protein